MSFGPEYFFAFFIFILNQFKKKIIHGQISKITKVGFNLFNFIVFHRY